MSKSARVRRLERKIEREKNLRDQFVTDKPMIQERLDYLREKLAEAQRD